MSFNGSGTFSINTSGQPVVTGTTISASVFNALTADLATGLSTCMLKDGTQTATAGIGFYAGTVSLPGIYFGTDTGTGFYRIGLNNVGFAVSGTKLLDLGTTVVAVTGSVTATTTISATTGMAVGGATPGAGGLAFPATQVAVANANTLDDYEEGTWTPALVCGTSGTITIASPTNAMTYTKIGRMVTVSGLFSTNAISSPVGALTLSGLPFAQGTGDTFRGGGSFYMSGGATTVTAMIWAGKSAATNINLYTRLTTGQLSSDASDVTNATDFFFNFSYFTD